MLLHFTAVLFLLYNRITAAFHRNDVVFPLLWALVTIAELIFTFVWVLTQSFRWRPVSRSVSPENLPGDEELPGVNVFIPTVDPAKEPTVEVMNTVLSSLALEYPAEKVGIYLSDDGGSPVTLYALKETFLQYQKESRSAFKVMNSSTTLSFYMEVLAGYLFVKMPCFWVLFSRLSGVEWMG